MLKTITGALILLVVGGLGWYGYNHFFPQSQHGDGVDIPSPTNGYSNEAVGLSFSYDAGFELVEHSSEGITRITLIEKGYTPPKNGEGPPTISVDVVPSNAEQFDINDVLPELSARGFTFSSDMLLATTTVAHREAYLFRTDGLYAGYATVIKAGAYTYIFNVQYHSIEDEILNMYASLLGTVEIN